jgi:outer membrane protein OmpA-like peptidoglycan-associated protein
MLLPVLLTSLLAGAPSKTAAVELQDALDLTNGALLVKETPSYGHGVSAWAPWRLTDGSPAGWCSASGKATEGRFEYELEGAWSLESFVVDTANTEEAGYAGISAKTVELWLANGPGAFKSLGTFTVPQHAKKAFPLPKGTLATRVKVDVLGNWGYGEYTELSELDLLGTRVKAPPLADFTGLYESTYGPLRLEQDGDQVYGCYDWGSIVGSVWGTVSGRIAQLTWYEQNQESKREGTAVWAAQPDAHGKPGFWGVWFENGELHSDWSGVTSVVQPKCQVQKRGQLARQLHDKGHVALYGIRFDVNKDVPLPESEGTLKELASVFAGDPKLTAVIEGHTDGTNTDAYNQDLSDRRAASVVRWLTGHGVPATQLTAKGYGKTKPVADNATAQGRALNRRVEVSIAP